MDRWTSVQPFQQGTTFMETAEVPFWQTLQSERRPFRDSTDRGDKSLDNGNATIPPRANHNPPHAMGPLPWKVFSFDYSRSL